LTWSPSARSARLASTASGTTNYVGDYAAISSDNTIAVFLEGTSSTAYKLKASPVKWPGTIITLHSATSTQYYFVFGMK
jgi:hypothetical protein